MCVLNKILTELYFFTFFKKFPEIQYFQLHKKEGNNLDILIAPHNIIEIPRLKKLKLQLLNILGKKYSLVIKSVLYIDFEKNGKYSIIKT